MNNRQERQLETFRRALVFLAHNPPTPPPANFAVQTQVLGDSISRLGQSAVSQNTGHRLLTQETRRQRAVRLRLRKEQMQPVARIARALLSTAPGIDRALKAAGPHVRTESLIVDARAMAEAAKPYVHIFVENGLPPSFADDLKASAAELEQSLDNRRGFRGRRGSATAGVRSEVGKARQALKLLDAMVRPFYSRDDTLIAGWNDAKRVQRVSGNGGVIAGAVTGTTGTASTPSATPGTGVGGSGSPAPAPVSQTSSGVPAHA